MGFASYREDIIKIKDDAAHFRRLLEEDGRGTSADKPLDAITEAGRRIQSYCSVLDGIITQCDKLLSLATEPEIILADELAKLKVERDEATAEAHLLRQKLAECDAAQRRAVEEFEAKLTETKGLVADLKKRARQSERDFERLASENFGAAVAIYPPGDKRENG
jgi:hypothetical protein